MVFAASLSDAELIAIEHGTRVIRRITVVALVRSNSFATGPLSACRVGASCNNEMVVLDAPHERQFSDTHFTRDSSERFLIFEQEMVRSMATGPPESQAS